MEYVLATQGLSKHYKDFKALDNLTMHVPKGSIYGFVGRNGAGKTTLIRVICGLQAPTAGSYLLYGTDCTRKEIAQIRRRMGAVVETPSIYLDLTAEDNLKEQFRVLGVPSDDGIPELLKLVGLEDTGKKKARNFSLGMKQRLGIAVALAGSPDFLVLDEPVNGLDPQGIIDIRELILKLNRERNITVLISSHILDELSRLATHYGFIDSGRHRQGAVRPGAGGRLPQVPAGGGHRYPCPGPGAGRHGGGLQDTKRRAGGRVRPAEHLPAQPRPGRGGLRAAVRPGAGREPGELLRQSGGGCFP